ncbi:pseudaminic acid cytidylyltransferase [Spirosoma sp. SC4-14]|uniref:pseudaminic acid cytidylyltransferase n=1 Tax=Spirosoma sp. SC4-14 TaxID=3128900 RepID=UPI0030D3CE6B
MSNLAIITARGGSKRIPRKNIRPFLGKPIIAYSITTAIQSGMFDEVMVSTDDVEIAAIAKEYGASVPFLRDSKTADDFATTAEVLTEVLTQYNRQGSHFKQACCLYPTAPFITPYLLQSAFDLLVKRGFDSVYPIQPFNFPIQRAIRLQGGKVQWFQAEHALTRSQDLEPSYHDAGQFYFFSVNAFEQTRRLISDNSGGIIISEMDAHDIDTEDDWEIAEFKFQLNRSQEKR